MSFKTFIEPTEKVVVNCVITFVQAFLPAWLASGFSTDTVVLTSLGSAALSVVWNTVGKPYLVSQGWLRA